MEIKQSNTNILPKKPWPIRVAWLCKPLHDHAGFCTCPCHSNTNIGKFCRVARPCNMTCTTMFPKQQQYAVLRIGLRLISVPFGKVICVLGWVKHNGLHSIFQTNIT